jgi:hypothetical protein
MWKSLCIGGEGELPFQVVQLPRQASGPGGQEINLPSYGDEPPNFFGNRGTDDLHLSGLREINGW